MNYRVWIVVLLVVLLLIELIVAIFVWHTGLSVESPKYMQEQVRKQFESSLSLLGVLWLRRGGSRVAKN